MYLVTADIQGPIADGLDLLQLQHLLICTCLSPWYQPPWDLVYQGHVPVCQIG